MENISGKRLSTWKAIIISDIHTGATKRFELDENERLIEKIKPNRRSHIPQQHKKIRITKKFRQKHKELDMILDHMVNLYKKKDQKKDTSNNSNSDQKQQSSDQNTSKEVSGCLYKELIDRFFMNPEDNENVQENQFILLNELEYSNLQL